MKRGVLLKIVGIAVLISMLILVYKVNPEYSLWMPKCIFYKITGYKCPACGCLRGIHQLLHGNIYNGLMYNPYMLISLPIGIGVILTSFSKNKLAIKMRPFLQHRFIISFYIVTFVLWWVIRNTINL